MIKQITVDMSRESRSRGLPVKERKSDCKPNPAVSADRSGADVFKDMLVACAAKDESYHKYDEELMFRTEKISVVAVLEIDNFPALIYEVCLKDGFKYYDVEINRRDGNMGFYALGESFTDYESAIEHIIRFRDELLPARRL
jgi:hypothetical protein